MKQRPVSTLILCHLQREARGDWRQLLSCKAAGTDRERVETGFKEKAQSGSPLMGEGCLRPLD